MALYRLQRKLFFTAYDGLGKQVEITPDQVKAYAKLHKISAAEALKEMRANIEGKGNLKDFQSMARENVGHKHQDAFKKAGKKGGDSINNLKKGLRGEIKAETTRLQEEAAKRAADQAAKKEAEAAAKEVAKNPGFKAAWANMGAGKKAAIIGGGIGVLGAGAYAANRYMNRDK